MGGSPRFSEQTLLHIFCNLMVNLAVFLASDDAAMVPGSVYYAINGGAVVKRQCVAQAEVPIIYTSPLGRVLYGAADLTASPRTYDRT